jgi:catalase
VHVREAMVGHLRHIAEDLANRVAAGLAFGKMPDAQVAAAPVKEMKPSPALQIIGKMKDTIMGRAIGILIADGSDGAVIEKIRKAAMNEGATVKIVALKVGGREASQWVDAGC